MIQHYKPPGANKDLQTFIQKQTFTGVEPLTHFNTTLHATRCKQTCKTSTPTNTYKHKLNLQVRRRSHLITLTQHCHQVQTNIYKNKHLQTLANIYRLEPLTHFDTTLHATRSTCHKMQTNIRILRNIEKLKD